MTDRAQSTGKIKGHDAMHRARKRGTHPTHACSEHSCGVDAMPIASRLARRENGMTLAEGLPGRLGDLALMLVYCNQQSIPRNKNMFKI